MEKQQKKVYVACALSYVPDDKKVMFSGILKDVKEHLRTRDLIVLDFLSAVKDDPSPSEVYKYDVECLNNTDYLLALGDYPGTGLGYEISYTVELRKIPTMVGVFRIKIDKRCK